MDKTHKFNIGYVLIGLMLVVLFQLWFRSIDVAIFPYREFQAQLAEKQIASVVVTDNRLEGEFVSPQGDKTRFVTNHIDPEIAAELDKAQIEYSVLQESHFLANLLSWVLPALVFFVLWIFVFRKFAEKQGFGGMTQRDYGVALLLEKETLTLAEFPAMKPCGSQPQSCSTVSAVPEEIH